MTRVQDVTMGDRAAELAFELIRSIGAASHWLAGIPPARTGERPRPGGWSAREIVGHLIDSASNNHGRFVRAALDDNLDAPRCVRLLESCLSRPNASDSPAADVVRVADLLGIESALA